MAILTMAQYLVTEPPPPAQFGATQLFLEEAGAFYSALPFETVNQLGVHHNKQTALPSSAARAIGETYTASVGTVEPAYEAMKVYGGTVQFDRLQVETGNGSRYVSELADKAQSAARNFIADFFKGDTASDPRVVNGLQNVLTDTSKNLYSPGTGAATYTRFETAKKMCRRPTHVLMGEGLHTRFSAALQATGSSGYVTRTADETGMPIMRLGGLPVIVVERDEADAEILDFSEASSSTSMYIVSLGPSMLHGVQQKLPRAEDLGLSGENGVQYNGVVDWPATYIRRHDRCAVRWSGITDAAVTL